MKSKFLIGVLIFVCSTSAVSSHAIDTPNRNLVNLTPGSFAFVFNEGNQGFGNIASFLVSRQTKFTPPAQPDTHLCANFRDPVCNVDGFDAFDAVSVLDPCKDGEVQACVKELIIFDKSGIGYPAKVVRTIDAPTFPGEPSVNLEPGGATSLWRVEGFDGIKDYAVSYFIQAPYYKTQGSQKFTPRTFSVHIYPFKEKAIPNATKRIFKESIYPDGRLGIVGGSMVTDHNCIWTEDGKCGVEQEFDDEISPQLTIIVPNSLTGWLNGRLINPEISVSPIGSAMNELTVKAKPADVPSAFAEIPYSQTTDDMKQLYKFNSHALSGSSVRDNVAVAGEMGFKYMAAFQNLLSDRAQLKATSWKFGSLDGVVTGPENTCLQSNSKILGLVTTNAMIYENTLPKFERGYLNYKLGGLHFNPDGTPFKGMYDLIMRSETARCLYGFSNAPVSAEISVVSADGEKQVATTRLTESKDWIHLSAYNFGFSSPTIQMKLEQEAEKIVSPNPISTPTPQAKSDIQSASVAKKKITITCIKGKVISRVTSVNPKCPKGYKKK